MEHFLSELGAIILILHVHERASVSHIAASKQMFRHILFSTGETYIIKCGSVCRGLVGKIQVRLFIIWGI